MSIISSQRGSDELFSTCVSNGPFIMSGSASAGESKRLGPRESCLGRYRVRQERGPGQRQEGDLLAAS